MSIIISSNGEKATKVDKSPIEKEDFLQQYIYVGNGDKYN